MNRLLVLGTGLLLGVAGCGAKVPLPSVEESTETETLRPGGKNPVVVIDTSMGKIKVELLADKAPGTVKNFLGYVDDKFYDGTIVHYAVEGASIRGGCFEPGMNRKPTKPPIKNESANGVSNARATVGLFRGRHPDSAAAEFYINVVDNGYRSDPRPKQPGFCVFGKVIEGMDTVDKIVAVPVEDKDDLEAVPVEDIVIKSIRREP